MLKFNHPMIFAVLFPAGLAACSQGGQNHGSNPPLSAPAGQTGALDTQPSGNPKSGIRSWMQANTGKPEHVKKDGNLGALRDRMSTFESYIDVKLVLAEKMIPSEALRSLKSDPLTADQCEALQKKVAANYTSDVFRISGLCGPLEANAPLQFEEASTSIKNQFGLAASNVLTVTRLTNGSQRGFREFTLLNASSRIIERIRIIDRQPGDSDASESEDTTLNDTFGDTLKLHEEHDNAPRIEIASFDSSGNAYVKRSYDPAVKNAAYVGFTSADGKILHSFRSVSLSDEDSSDPGKWKTTHYYSVSPMQDWTRFEIAPTLLLAQDPSLASTYIYGTESRIAPTEIDELQTVSVSGNEVCAEGSTKREKTDSTDWVEYLQEGHQAFDCDDKF